MTWRLLNTEADCSRDFQTAISYVILPPAETRPVISIPLRRQRAAREIVGLPYDLRLPYEIAHGTAAVLPAMAPTTHGIRLTDMIHLTDQWR